MANTVLLVDDEERLRSLLRAYLSQEGYRILAAANGREALHIARQEKPDLIVLDVMMPEMDGLEFLRQFRAREQGVPVIMLTARVDEADMVLGLELGADDYVTKPFSPRVLVARVRAALRRAGLQNPPAKVLRAADIAVDRDAHRVTVGERPVELTPSEFDLLSALMSTPGRVYSRAELLEHVQGVAYEAYERTIDVHIRNLRLKIGDDTRNPRYIETVYGVGYRFLE
ncbi:MAG: response regulator transcription factor [Chloroflexi bacterium]|nr:response regulator transcription factor [Chloroflexota bacterium]